MRFYTLLLLGALLSCSCGGGDLPQYWEGVSTEVDLSGDPVRAVQCTQESCICYDDMEHTVCSPVTCEEEAWHCCR